MAKEKKQFSLLQKGGDKFTSNEIITTSMMLLTKRGGER